MLGENKYNNNGKKDYPTVYSNYKMSNAEAEEPTQLSFSFTLNGLLKVIIAPKKGVTDEGYTSYDHENEAFAFISYTKAKILSREIRERLLKGIVPIVAVDTKHGLISVCNTNGVYSLNISDIDPNTGLIMTQYSYVFKDNNRAIENYNVSTGDFDTYTYPEIEVEAFADLLDEYYKSSSNALAYSVINANRFNDGSIKGSLEAIKKQLNIPTSGQYSQKPSGGQYFTNKPSQSTSQLDYSDLENKIEDM